MQRAQARIALRLGVRELGGVSGGLLLQTCAQAARSIMCRLQLHLRRHGLLLPLGRPALQSAVATGVCGQCAVAYSSRTHLHRQTEQLSSLFASRRNESMGKRGPVGSRGAHIVQGLRKCR